MQTSRTLRDAEEKTRTKVRRCFDSYWLVNGFTAFTPVRFTYETNNTYLTPKSGVQKLMFSTHIFIRPFKKTLISRVNY